MELPKISIIIPTYNSSRTLKDCLESIINQTYPLDKLEIIVVDNNSSDKSRQIAQNYTDKIVSTSMDRSAARNYGAGISNGDYLLFLDSDMILSRNVIIESVQHFLKDKNLAGIYIPECVVGQGYFIKVRNFERSFYNATCIDAIRILPRSIFLKSGGFDINLIAGEDWDLDRRIQSFGCFDLIQSPLYHNEGGFKLKPYLTKKNFYSKSIDRYIEKYGIDDPIIKKQIGIIYRFWGVFTENGKWKKLLMHPILTVSMYLNRCLVGITYLRRNR